MRTNINKINTFDTIIENTNLLVSNKFYTVIRLNVDKTNYKSVSNLLSKLKNLVSEKYFGEYLTVDIARVFGSDKSFDLYEYEDIRQELFNIASANKLIKINLGCKDLTTFCIAEGLSDDLVIDFKGNLYRCWNNVFNTNHRIGTIDELKLRNYNPYEITNITLEFVNKLSLNRVNGGKCFDCEFCKYCHGLCPAVRKSIINGEERNIYKNDECKEIIKKRLNQLLRCKLENND